MGYYWLNLCDDVTQFSRTCLICQQDKVEQSKIARLLKPLSVSSRPWESVSLDFITYLSKVGEMESILVIVERFSKYTTFVPTPKSCNGKTTTQLFFQHVAKLWGIPMSIINDHNARFTRTFRTELFKLLGLRLNISSNYHPKIDRQT